MAKNDIRKATTAHRSVFQMELVDMRTKGQLLSEYLGIPRAISELAAEFATEDYELICAMKPHYDHPTISIRLPRWSTAVEREWEVLYNSGDGYVELVSFAHGVMNKTWRLTVFRTGLYTLSTKCDGEERFLVTEGDMDGTLTVIERGSAPFEP